MVMCVENVLDRRFDGVMKSEMIMMGQNSRMMEYDMSYMEMNKKNG